MEKCVIVWWDQGKFFFSIILVLYCCILYKSIVLLTSLPRGFVEGKVGDMKHGGFSDDRFKSSFFSNMPTKKTQYKHTEILTCVIDFWGDWEII